MFMFMCVSTHTCTASCMCAWSDVRPLINVLHNHYYYDGQHGQSGVTNGIWSRLVIMTDNPTWTMGGVTRACRQTQTISGTCDLCYVSSQNIWDTSKRRNKVHNHGLSRSSALIRALARTHTHSCMYHCIRTPRRTNRKKSRWEDTNKQINNQTKARKRRKKERNKQNQNKLSRKS